MYQPRYVCLSADVGRNGTGWHNESPHRCVRCLQELGNFPKLSRLYLHANAITSLAEVEKLQSLGNTLRSLTLHGNPVAEKPLCVLPRASSRHRTTLAHAADMMCAAV